MPSMTIALNTPDPMKKVIQLLHLAYDDRIAGYDAVVLYAG